MLLNGVISIQIALNSPTSVTRVQLPGRVLVTIKQAKQEKVERAVKWYNAKINHSDYMILVGRLRKCNAVILKSYDTIVAFIDKYEMGLYDFSRLVYENRYTWKEVR